MSSFGTVHFNRDGGECYLHPSPMSSVAQYPQEQRAIVQEPQAQPAPQIIVMQAPAPQIIVVQAPPAPPPQVIVVQAPQAYQEPSRQELQPSQESVAPVNMTGSYEVNVANSDGTFVPVILKRHKGGFLGPQGEYYPRFPKVDQLRVMYAN